MAALRDGHILPKWVYKRIRDEDGILVYRRSAGQDTATGGYTDKQLKEHMLCEDCEQRFSKRETYVSQLAFNEGEMGILRLYPPAARQSLREKRSRYAVCADALDREAIAYFALSVVWRADISKECHATKLGPCYREIFRKCLDGGTFPDDVSVLFSYMDDPTEGEPDHRQVAQVPATGVRKNHGVRYHSHRFVICGLFFDVACGQQLPAEQKKLCIRTIDRLPVMPGGEIGILKNFGKTIRSAREKGRLARERA